ncbi:Signal transduction histidine kinase [Halobiforma haloterrestris]|uniref:histidine kinase n=1 Tax=Natronobacterium haloterrestre TaxID=148448 RepID=A0A1I1HXS2_NATHA|nr:GAF domain-containing sensor histidine kinase [Halobiforma haloterrestris]SFC28585.1 Signal transduction histidine kinase [Halobiforma haloterrestris]
MARTRGGGNEEHPIQVLHQVAFDLQSADSADEVCRRTVDAAETVLEFDTCIITLAEGETLRVRAKSSGLPDDGVTPTSSIDEGISGLTYRTRESSRFDELSSVEEAEPEAAYESGLSVPIGDHGVFQAASEEPGAFSPEDLELAELLVSHAAAALDRLEYERELEQFASVVSHDLRNPLTVARGRLELARSAANDDAQPHLAEIDEALERMNSLVEKLLALARQGELVEEAVPVALRDTVEDAWETVATDDARLVVSVAEGTVLEADRERLRQLLENLFRNSVEHGAETDSGEPVSVPVPVPVTVTVGTLPDGFYVADDGPGLPDDADDEVFRRGYTTSDDGTGFGLYIVRRIVRGHGWSVSLTASEDGGARFEITGAEIDRSGDARPDSPEQR